MPFCNWIISFSIMSSRFSHVTCVRIPTFFRLHNSPLYVYTMFYLSIHLLMGIWVVSSVWLLWIMLLHMCVFKTLLSFILDNYLEVEFFDHMVISSFNFLRDLRTGFHTPIPFLLPIDGPHGFQPSHLHQELFSV